MEKVFVHISINSKGDFNSAEVSGSNVKAVIKAVKALETEFMPKVEFSPGTGRVFRKSPSK